VVPVGAALLKRKAVNKGFPRGNSIEADAGYTIHLIGQQYPVPVNGGGDRQAVGDADGDVIAFPQP